MADAEVSSTQRRRLRSVLRQLRSEAGLTQEHVAAEMDWSLSKVIRIETGAVSVSVNDVRALLNLYRVLDRPRAEEIIELARAARQKPWWYAYRDNYSPSFQSYLDLEAGAAVLKFHQPALVPGLLQTTDYARAAVFATADEAQAAERVEMEIEVRQYRQHAIFDQPDPPQIMVVLDEAVLRRPLGGRATMRQQLRHLQQVQERPHVALRILSFNADVVGGNFGQFVILEFENDESPAVYLEALESADKLRSEHRVSDPYVQLFDRLRGAALDEDASMAFIRKLADELS